MSDHSTHSTRSALKKPIRALLVQTAIHTQKHPPDLEEFIELSKAAGAEPLAVIGGANRIPDPKYFIGCGKVDHLCDMVTESQPDIVLFNHHLSPIQERNLECKIQCRVLDRVGLILDIFAQHAKTFEGKLQVELAQLQYLSTRLVRGWTHLERQKGGIGLRGPGEKQLETDRRLVRRRIIQIKKQLDKVRNQREQNRRSRRRANLPTLALVGYTNAGKSTLFNQLATERVYASDQPFATLDPTLRQLSLPGVGKVILADTVGFIHDLPHTLVESFRATLEEVNQASLLLHVVDAQDLRHDQLIQDVEQVLKAIGADDRPVLLVYNKSDQLPEKPSGIEYDTEHNRPYRVWISALVGQGMEALYQAIAQCLGEFMIEREVILPVSKSKLRSELYALGCVQGERVVSHQKGCVCLKVRMSKRLFESMGLGLSQA